jgi:hypothetical protein
VININESNLIEFFETPPTKQTNDEKEFFGTTIFDVKNLGQNLHFCISSHFSDLYIELKGNIDEKPTISLHMENLKELKIVQDKQSMPSFLRASCTTSSVEIRTKPRLSINILIEENSKNNLLL